MRALSLDRCRTGVVLTFTAVALLLFALPTAAFAQFDDEDDEFRPGLIAEFLQGETTFQRVDAAPLIGGGRTQPDPRLTEGAFGVGWGGYLMSQVAGEYRFYAYGSGEMALIIGDTVVSDNDPRATPDDLLLRSLGDERGPGWIEFPPLELPFDWHPIEIHYKPAKEHAGFALYWSGPNFQLEPISPRQFFHDPEKTPSGDFERGRLLARALRCGACHETPEGDPSAAAPALDRLAGNIDRNWLVNWLHDEQQNSDGEEPKNAVLRRMPHFDHSVDEAEALTAYLLSASKKPRTDKTETKPGNTNDGQHLFLTLGCLACHQSGALGESGLFGGGDLTHIADKRPPRYFLDWLAAPDKLNAQHRMPVFELSKQERSDLAAYLATRNSDTDFQLAAAAANNDTLIAAGQKLFQQRRCAACHEQDDKDKAADSRQKLPLSKISNWAQSCAGAPNSAKQRPGYQLSPADQTAVEQYFRQMPDDRQVAGNRVDSGLLLVEKNCLACHARDDSLGIAENLHAITQSHPELAAITPAMTPPPLTSVGDKLHDEALIETITRKSGVHRPWLAVRMPKFRLSDQELHKLVQHLVQADRIPPREDLPEPPAEDPRLDAAGGRLVSTEGFGCVSCHDIGKYKPPKAPLNARGPDLALLGKRIRYSWFDRWVRNPARIVPRMEMPSMQLAVRGVLDDHLDDQLAAVWTVLNRPDFKPPPPGAVRIARRSGIEDRNEPAVVLTDVLLQDGDTFIKPLLVGLPNRHNLLVDLQTNRLAGWWLGDAARQRTQGKTWYWETGGDNLFTAAPPSSEIALRRDGRLLAPALVGQFPTEFDELAHEDHGLTFRHRLFCEDAESDSDSERTLLHVTQSITPLWPGDGHAGGARRRIEVRGARRGDLLIFAAATSSGNAPARVSVDGRFVDWRHPSGARIVVRQPADANFVVRGDQIELAVSASSGDEPLAIEVDYLCDTPADLFPMAPPQFPPPPPVALNVTPGFETTRLPIAEEIMPTALAWRPDGTLAVASLKGRVWLARDTDGDELEDTIHPFGDELAAPFGLATGENYVDVVTKFALLRLFDEDGDGVCERTTTLASGWGHTDDYHDWTVGLPTDEQGNYYLAIPCQQDNRSAAAAHLRGTVVRLAAREPTSDDPHRFRLEQISGGHRFPIGIARNRAGEMFVTDNQGNYNPFNELNHVLPGKRYGFINAIERKPGFAPPLTPPAIDIPHPWTRSVNGICFLETPENLRASKGKMFGPYEGHLIGCEYDTRLLIRMSLEHVGDVVQGAAYPFSFYHPPDGNTFLGPLACTVSPRGDLYIGCLRDSGWGGANNIGALVRMRPQLDTIAPGIAEVRATSDGFVIDFTTAVDPKLAADVKNYTVSSYTRTSTPAYGGDDQERRVDKVAGVRVERDGGRAVLAVDDLRAGFVYEIRLKNLAGKGMTFFPAEAYYTLRVIPE